MTHPPKAVVCPEHTHTHTGGGAVVSDMTPLQTLKKVKTHSRVSPIPNSVEILVTLDNILICLPHSLCSSKKGKSLRDHSSPKTHFFLTTKKKVNLGQAL